MSYTQEQIDALRVAIARGVRKVQINGEIVEYHTLAEMRTLLAEMERTLAPAAVTRRHYPVYTRGT